MSGSRVAGYLFRASEVDNQLPWPRKAQFVAHFCYSIHYYALYNSLGVPPLLPHCHNSDLIKLQPLLTGYDLNQAI